DWRFPTANVVFGDARGRIGFSLAGALPLRSPLALEGGGAAHDGSASKHDWRAIIPHELMPHVIQPERGCLFSANHRPVGAFYPIPLGIRTGSMGDTVRSWRLRELLAGKSSLAPKQVLDVHYDTVNPARRNIVRMGLHLRDGLGRELSAEARRTLGRLEAWYAQGAPSSLDVPGAELAMEINTMFRFVTTELAYVYGGGDSGLSRFLKTVGRRLDDDAKAPIEPLEEEYVDRMLAGAWRSAVGKYGRDPEKWNELARRAVTERRLGYHESLDGFPSLDPTHDLSWPPLRCVDGQTILSQGAQSYTQWVPLSDVDAALSILPVGSSERVGSPTRTINRETWAQGNLHPAPLTRGAVERHAVSRTTLSP
ncbi:MAG: penicillin acylase family protein, partial [Planctomycetes bacterium]|nr:penicillin acylase family protein [Planctomycetota bacterium]